MINLISKRENNTYFDPQKLLEKFHQKINLLKDGKGSIMIIDGTKGLGKSRLLKEFERITNEQNIVNGYVKVTQPLGNIALSNLTPYSAFVMAIKDLSTNKKITPQKRLAVNVGMTLLASLPLAGDIFYAIKEIRRDLMDYTKFKRKSLAENANSFLEVFRSYSKRHHFVIFMDDFHFSDIQSFEFLQILMDEIKNIEACFVLSLDSSFAERQQIALRNFLAFYEQNPREATLHKLEPFDDTLISKAIQDYFPGEKVNSSILEWFRQKTFGVPMAIYEYLDYFKENKINLSKLNSIDSGVFIPTSLHSIFLTALDKLSEDEKNILAVCAADGREFSVSMVSKLLNKDVLHTIRSLKSIQNRTGLISSIGAKSHYGEKSTVYQFNQSTFQQYFESTLEYEEYKDIHFQIASILKQNFDNSNNPAVKNEIMPYLVAHSSISGDQEMIKEVLQEQIKIAKENDDEVFITGITKFIENISASSSNEQNFDKRGVEESTINIINSAENDYFVNNLLREEEESELDNMELQKDDIVPLPANVTLEDLIDISLNQETERTIKLIEQFANLTQNDIEKLKAKLILAKLYAESERYDKAIIIFNDLKYKVNEENPGETDALYLNSLAILKFQQGELDEALSLLKKASELSLKLGPNYKLLTLSNISIIIKGIDLPLAEKYKTAVMKIAKDLNYETFIEDYLHNYN